MSGPLAGVRVIDMTAVILGPYATQILGDLGADIIKVEPPKGDVVRFNGPSRSPGMGPVFLHLNRSKRSIVLDLKQEEGRAALLKLVTNADLLMYNMRPQSMARLGLTYEAVSKVNPRIIYCGAYGYGENGRYAGKPAYDDLIQGAAALPALEAKLGGEPRYLPTAIADRTVGLTAAYTMIAALFHRERTGQGQSVEIPMFEVMAESTLSTHMYGLTFEPPIGDAGYKRLLTRERRPYKTSDGYVCALPYTDRHWQRFFDTIDRPELKVDPRFVSMSTRTRHIQELYRIVVDAMLKKTTAQWLILLEEADIPVMPMHTLESLIEDPHLNESGFFSLIDHPTEGKIRSMAVPTRWSRSAPEVKRQAPRLGEHSREVLKEIGYTDADIARMVASGVTVDRRTNQ
ncbi:MAG: CoA transferase [Betaproteobacteria bacterium]|nr:CoA transferase [Betaproteobacteria bacterium]